MSPISISAIAGADAEACGDQHETRMTDNATQPRDETWRAMMCAAKDGDRAAYAQLLSELLPLLHRVVGRE